MNDHVTLSGTVQDVFAHRFTLRTGEGLVLADLTPDGLSQIALRSGDAIEIAGERKPSEIKISQLTRADRSITVAPGKKPGKNEHGKPGHGKPGHDAQTHAAVDPAPALAGVREAGFEVLDEPRRKPRHFEILGLRAGEPYEMHVELDGKLRHAKPIDRGDPKWAKALERNDR